MKKLLSIVIPTKDRYHTLLHVCKTLVKLNEFDENIDLIIHDNSANPIPEKEFLKINKSIRYIYYKESLPVSKNFDLAVSYAEGEYVLLLGDDDTVCIDVIKYIKHLKSNDIQSANCKMARYFWPGVKDKLLAKISIPYFTNKSKVLKTDELYDYSLKNSFQEIRYLPRCYHAFCSKKILDDVYKKYDSYFPGPSPDMSNAVAVLLEEPKHIYIDTPLIISGYSKASTAGLGQNGQHIGELKDQKHLDESLLNQWPKNVLFKWTGETIWYVSALFVLQKHNPNLDIPVNEMNARIFYRYGDIFHNSNNLNRFKLYFLTLIFIYKKILYKLNALDFMFFDKSNDFTNMTLSEFQSELYNLNKGE